MTCDHHLWNDPDAACCDRTTDHDRDARGGHTYASATGSWVADKHLEGSDE
jgi:hypothetical protein